MFEEYRSITSLLIVVVLFNVYFSNVQDSYSFINNSKSNNKQTQQNDTKQYTPIKLRDYNDLSFIIASRNDNYGNNPIRRLRFALQNLLLYEWKRLHNLSIQVIVIEWNPVSENPHIWQYENIKQLLSYKNDNSHIYDTEIIFYSIPSKFNDMANCHKERPNLYCPFYEYQAKNVGLRRSNGKWKVATNQDDLFSLHLMQILGYYMSHNLLDENGIYQAIRREIDINHQSIPHKLSRNNISVIDVVGHNYSEITTEIETQCVESKQCIFENNELLAYAGDFILIHNSTLYKYYGGGYVETCDNLHLDSEMVRRQIIVNKLKGYWIAEKWSYHHIKHYNQRLDRNASTSFINYEDLKIVRNKIDISKVKIECNQMSNVKFINIRLPNDTYWTRVYQYTNQNWGIKNVSFSPVFYC